MSAQPNVNLVVNAKSPANDSGTREGLQQRLKGLQSNEIVIGLSGPVGCGIDDVREILESDFQNIQYTVVYLKLSDFIKDRFKEIAPKIPDKIPAKLKDAQLGLPIGLDGLEGFARIDKLMDAGDWLRSQDEPDILAQLAIKSITEHRLKTAKPKYFDECSEIAGDPGKRLHAKGGALTLIDYLYDYFKPPKTVYLIDQLKNPEEVKLLRSIYGDLFYLLGTLSSEEERKNNLKKKMNEEEAVRLMDRDRKESEEHGQQLEKTLQYSDYFVRFSHQNNKHLKDQIFRFIRIIHGMEIITPTKDEHGMYVAYSASLKSACLSRQVGASIADEKGVILSTGCNDVPMFGGGLYTAESPEDLRCYNNGKICYNDDYKKREIKDKLMGILAQEMPELDKKRVVEITSKMFSTTRLKDLIEFSRAIHAEMDSIVGLARNGGVSTKGSTLYCTTYPCHNCARHIVAAGMRRVVYIEPYEKSLALELHKDAISIDPADQEKKVIFSHFEGVSPRKYQYFFMANEKRKENGKLFQRTDYNVAHKMPEYLYSYRQMEAKVAEHLSSKTDKVS